MQWFAICLKKSKTEAEFNSILKFLLEIENISEVELLKLNLQVLSQAMTVLPISYFQDQYAKEWDNLRLWITNNSERVPGSYQSHLNLIIEKIFNARLQLSVDALKSQDFSKFKQAEAFLEKYIDVVLSMMPEDFMEQLNFTLKGLDNVGSLIVLKKIEDKISEQKELQAILLIVKEQINKYQG